jgi:hypothetical protein
VIQIWRLSEASPDNLGLAFTDDALVLGRTPLIERRQGRFVVRQKSEIERLLNCAYVRQRAPMGNHLMLGLGNVAAALNANDPCLARIAAVQLKISELPNIGARTAIEIEDVLIKSLGDKLTAGDAPGFRKASPDDPEHPGWPKGTPDGKGGQFRPKNDAEIASEVKARALRLAARRAMRTAAIKLLRFSVEAAANLIPIVDVVADVAMVLDVADTVSQFWKLANDVTATLDFANKGPRSFGGAPSFVRWIRAVFELRRFCEGRIHARDDDKNVRRCRRRLPVSSHRHAGRREREQHPGRTTSKYR